MNSNHSHTRLRGFTLVEALVSSLILAFGAVIVCQLTHRCLTNTIEGLGYEQACRLLDETLDRITTGRLSDLAARQSIQGDFAPRYPRYRYQIKIERGNAPDLYRVQAAVLWLEGAHDYQVTAATLFYDYQKDD